MGLAGLAGLAGLGALLFFHTCRRRSVQATLGCLASACQARHAGQQKSLLRATNSGMHRNTRRTCELPSLPCTGSASSHTEGSKHRYSRFSLRTLDALVHLVLRRLLRPLLTVPLSLVEKRPLIIIVFLPCLMRGPSGVLLTDNLCRGTYQETAIVAVAPPDRNTTDGAFHVVDVLRQGTKEECPAAL